MRSPSFLVRIIWLVEEFKKHFKVQITLFSGLHNLVGRGIP